MRKGCQDQIRIVVCASMLSLAACSGGGDSGAPAPVADTPQADIPSPPTPVPPPLLRLVSVGVEGAALQVGAAAV
ncbi:MAG: hypothetical protein AAFY34_04580, partial [Pseudomonadota bacterium]